MNQLCDRSIYVSSSSAPFWILRVKSLKCKWLSWPCSQVRCEAEVTSLCWSAQSANVLGYIGGERRELKIKILKLKLKVPLSFCSLYSSTFFQVLDYFLVCMRWVSHHVFFLRRRCVHGVVGDWCGEFLLSLLFFHCSFCFVLSPVVVWCLWGDRYRCHQTPPLLLSCAV